jgi:hypothetical protein
MATTLARIGIVLLFMSSRCFASGYQGDLAEAWGRASIVVLGRPQIVHTVDNALENRRGVSGTYRVVVQQAYKGAKPDDKLEFIDPFCRSTAGLWIREGETYLIVLQSKDDRKKHPHPATNKLGDVLTGLRVFKVNDTNLAEIEAGIATVRTYESLTPKDRKAFLLQNLAVTNAYSHRLIVREIIKARITEAIPFFQQQLSQATTEVDKLRLISNLRCLGDPGVKATLLSWLADDSFHRKREVIDALVNLKDKSLVPTLRNYVDAKDDLVAVAARNGLLQLGDPDAKRLILDMIEKSTNPIARYNAIHQLNWGYSGDFTDNEKKTISDLVHDKDQSVARVAGFIVEKWSPRPSKPSEATKK